MSYSKYRAAVVSKAFYSEDGVGFSKVMSDFPFEVGPLAYYDTVSNIMKPWSRDPATGDPLYVIEVDRYTGTVVTDGVTSTSDYATPTKDTIPAACIVLVQVSSASVLANIDAAATHMVLGVDPNPLDGSEELPAGLQPYQWDVPMPSARWTTLRNALVSLGVDETLLDNWASNNEDFTPKEFGEAFKAFIQ